MPILIGADVGGSKTAVGVSDGPDVLARADGPGADRRAGAIGPYQDIRTLGDSYCRLAAADIGADQNGHG